MNNYPLKKAVPGDLERLVRHRVHLFEKAGKIGSPKEFEDMVKRNYDYFAARLESDEAGYFFMEDEKGTILTIGAYCLLHKPPINYIKSGVEGYIFNMYTAEHCRGKGLAAAVLGHIQAHLASLGVYKVSLEANERSFPLYERNGFNRDSLYLVKNK